MPEFSPADRSSDDTQPVDSPPSSWARIIGWRSERDRYVAGVLGGLGERFDVDPFFLRAAVVACSVHFSTLGRGDWGTTSSDQTAAIVLPLIYLGGWLLVPDVARGPIISRIFRSGGWREALGAVVAFLACAAILASTGFGPLAVVLLIGLAWLLLRTRPEQPVRASTMPAPPVQPPSRNTPTSDAPASDPTPPPPPHAVGEEAVAPSQRARWAASRRREWGRPRSAPLVAPRRRQRRARREPALWPLTVALLVALAVVSWVADRTVPGGIDPSIPTNLALIVIGAVVVLSAWRGRALGTMVLALPLMVPWLAFSAADIGRFEGEGVLSVQPATLSDEPLVLERGYGAIEADLTQLALSPGQQVDIDAAVTAGTITVWVPPTADVRVSSHLGVGLHTVRTGWYDAFDEEPGVDRTFVRWHPALQPTPNPPTINIRTTLGIGTVEVIRLNES